VLADCQHLREISIDLSDFYSFLQQTSAFMFLSLQSTENNPQVPETMKPRLLGKEMAVNVRQE
jgi:hypothetical protein